jgi:hypothetical protein
LSTVARAVLTLGPRELNTEVLRADSRRRAAATQGEPARAAQVLRPALALWTGLTLADVPYEPWAQTAIALLQVLTQAAIVAA